MSPAAASTPPSSSPLVSIVIPTYHRQRMAHAAVISALNQTISDVEVIVVDDASPQKPDLPDDSRLRLIRLPDNRGGGFARNSGARAASGQYLVFLDDDDTLEPGMIEVSLQALQRERQSRELGLPEPIAVLTGLRIINEQGVEQEVHMPVTLPRGKHYSLEKLKPGTSPFCKQTLFIEREVFLAIGGFDVAFRSRQQSELFFRLNQQCSILGVPVVTYNWHFHGNTRITRDREKRQKGFYDLVEKYRPLFEAHPDRFSWYLRDHAYRSFLDRHYWPALVAGMRAMKQDPKATIRWITRGFPNETDPRHMS